MQAATDVTRPTGYPVPIEERIRKLPDAILLTAGYYASRVPALGWLLQRLD